MKFIKNISILRAVKPLLLLCFGLLTTSSLSLARSLQVGDEYGGGIVIYLFPPDDGKVKKSADEVVIVGKTNMSERLYWSHLKTASDTFNGALYRDWVEPGGISAGTVAGIEFIERDAHRSFR